MLTERQSRGCFCARLLEKTSQVARVEAERDMRKARHYPAAALAEALDLYAKTGSKARVRDFLFPKHRPAKRPGRPVRGAEAGGDALGIQPAAHGAAASARAAG